MLESKFLKAIRKFNLIENQDKILIAFSGGPDSLVLTNLLLKFQKTLNILEIQLAHLNHALRKESDQDQEFCEKFANNLGLKIHVKKVDVKKVAKELKISVEEAGRLERYKFFNEILQKENLNKIATGHHLSDLTESIVLWFIQGNKRGLKGFRPKENNIIRPLYLITKEEIEEYCQKNGLVYLVDQSNFSRKYLRNQVRLDVIPILKKINPDLENSMLNLSQFSYFDESYLDKLTEEYYSKLDNKNLLDLSFVNNLPNALKYRLLIKWIYKNTNTYLSYKQILSLMEILDKQGQKEIKISRDIKVVKTYDKLEISTAENMENLQIEYKLKVGQKIFLKEFCMEIESYIIDAKDFKKDNNTECFDLPEDSVLEIRTRKEGDRFLPFNRKTEKKLKDVFIDLKIPKYVRDSIPLLVYNNKILWIIGYKRSGYYPVSENSTKVICFRYKEVQSCN
jgi:tRNA(Ile)-lysidine synthase